MKHTRPNTTFPKPFSTDWMDTGSRTLDPGHRFIVTVDDDGFQVHRELGPMSSDEIFDELGYWPEHVAWTGTAESLSTLLAQLARARKISVRKLRSQVVTRYADYDYADLRSFLLAEKQASKQLGALQRLWAKWPQLREEQSIVGISSPTFGKDTFYNAIKIALRDEGWWVELHSDEDGDLPEILIPEIWNAETFDGLFEAKNYWGQDLESFLRCDSEKLSQMLCADDPRWIPLLKRGPVYQGHADTLGQGAQGTDV